jgi:hypothetical protein
MKGEEIREFLRTKPVRPFFVQWPGGRQVSDFHPDIHRTP